MASKENIVFIHCDSMDGRKMGCMDYPALRRVTLNLDRLASDGVLFKSAYSNSPICCPSRASMWSGQFTHHCEGWNNYKGLTENNWTFRDYFEEAGYNFGHFGKKDYLSGSHSIRARVTAWTGSADIKRPAHKERKPEIINNKNKKLHKMDWEALSDSIDWIEQNVKKNNKPFMLYLGIRAPHSPFITNERYYNLINEQEVDIPPADENKHPVMEYQKIIKNWEYGFSEEIVKKVRRIYFAMIAEVDNMVGQLMKALEDIGVKDSTYIIFSSDHGEMAMEHQQYGKMNLYEPSIHVPLIISGPGLLKGIIIDKLVSLVDIFPTLMDLAGIKYSNNNLDGCSLIPELRGKKSHRKDWVLSEFHGATLNTSTFMLRKNKWKFIAYVGYEPQLFDLDEDPYEIINLAKVKPKKIKEMDKILRKIVDYQKITEKVESYKKRSFSKWCDDLKDMNLYEPMMAHIYSGGIRLSEDEIKPWTGEDQKKIIKWLGSDIYHDQTIDHF